MKISLDAIEWDNSPPTGSSYTITIWPRGLINFSADAVNRFELKKKPFVKLGYIRERKLLVFKFLDEQSEQGALPATERQKGIIVSARGTLDKFSVDFEGKTMRYPLEEDTDSGLFVANLNDGIDAKRSKKSEQ
ncbi:hypothetical protein [Fundidesulfovibrio agrisoli]|uniref:hypothetical protein n=1 Tax=Fundidesulfovibrio agrisoli TaxID=2922717 RepID=UPI001FAE691D|nr:hypothetical protein [Fundidesulfovibrio agrisoli]